MTWQHILGGILLLPIATLVIGVIVWQLLADWRSFVIATLLVTGFIAVTVGGIYLISGGN